MVVVKFGGTSVGAVPQIDQAARIVQSMRDSKPVVVVSAMGGITDALLQAGEAAFTGRHSSGMTNFGKSEAGMIGPSTNYSRTATPFTNCRTPIAAFGKRFRRCSQGFRSCAR